MDKAIVDLANEVIERDKARNTKFEAMDTMFHNRSTAPAELKGLSWFRWFPSTRPSDSAWGAARVLTSIEPRVTVYPLGNEDKDREEADRRERILSYQYWGAKNRSKINPTRQIVLSSILYDMTAVRTDFIPYLKRGDYVNKKRLSTAARFGQYAVNPMKPAGVHPVFDQWGLASVVHAVVVPRREALGYWDNDELKEGDGEYVYVVDYWDHDNRITWATVTETPGIEYTENTDAIKLVEQEHGLPFIPWNIKGGGSVIETDPEFHHRPLLDSIYHADQFHNANVIRSLMLSRIWAEFAKPLTKSVTHDGETPNYDFRQPGGNIPLQLGEDIQDMAPANVNPALLTASQIIDSDMEASTVSRVLLGETPNDVAFATLNLGQQSAARSIIPYQEVAEETLTGVFTDFLLWAEFAKEDIQGIDLASKSVDRDYKIKHTAIDPDNILLEVKLEADVPTDRIQKINAGVMLHRDLGVSRKKVYEELGLRDASLIEEQRAQEDMDAVEHQNALQGLSQEFINEIRQQIEAEIMGQIQAQAQQQGQGNPEDPTQGVPGAEGQGFTPRLGGSSSIELAPESNTPEGQNGVDRGGNQIE